MAFKDFHKQERGIRLLQSALERGRLAHAYLFVGHQLEELEALAGALAKTLNCLKPIIGAGRVAVDCCDQCLNCRKIDHGNHADVHWVRPETRTRVITISQVRELMQQIYLKPTEAAFKVAVIGAADRLNVQAANAFLKTLEEPPARSILILLTTEPQRVLETILSRCLRVPFAGDNSRPLTAAEREWLEKFSEMAAAGQKGLLGRYRLLDVLLQRLGMMKSATEADLTARSPLQQHADADQDLRERWESELSAAIEASYRRQRSELMVLLQRWLRDILLRTLPSQTPASDAGERGPGTGAVGNGLFEFPQLAGPGQIASRISAAEALKNLEVLEEVQRLLHTNVQEALALEVGLLKLHL